MVNASVTAPAGLLRLRLPGIARGRHSFVRDRSANVLMTFALLLPIIVLAIGAAVDYGLASSGRSKMQAVADAAALAAAKQLQLALTDERGAETIVKNYVNGLLADATTNVTFDFRMSTIQVRIQKQYAPMSGTFWFKGGIPLSVSATATLSRRGALPLCRLRLDPAAPGTFHLVPITPGSASACVIRYAHPQSSLAR